MGYGTGIGLYYDENPKLGDRIKTVASINRHTIKTNKFVDANDTDKVKSNMINLFKLLVKDHSIIYGHN